MAHSKIVTWNESNYALRDWVDKLVVPFLGTKYMKNCFSYSGPTLWNSLPCNALISGHPGGLTPGTCGAIAGDLLSFVANLWPGTGALDRSCTSEARYTGKDPRDFVTSPPSWNWKIRTAGTGYIAQYGKTGRSKCMFVEIVILWLTRYKAEPHCVQKTGGLAIFAFCVYYC